MSNDEFVIKVENLTKAYHIESERTDTFSAIKKFITGSFPLRELYALKKVNLRIKKGEAVALIGPNGSGKSTLLKLLSQITIPTSGKVKIKGDATPFFSISSGLYEKLTIEDNIKICAALFNIAPISEAFVEKILKKTELEKYRNAKLSELSLGLKMRLPFIIGLHSNSDIFLIDEVMSVGDNNFKQNCFSLLKKLLKKNKTMVFATHDASLIENFATRIIKFEKGTIVNDKLSHQLKNQISHGKYPYMNKIYESSLIKYDLFFTKLGSIENVNRVLPKPATDEDLAIVHTKEWIERLKLNNLTESEEIEWAIPKSKFIIPKAWNIAGATIKASLNALKSGIGISAIGGGNHADNLHGGGFCPINDIAIATRKLQNSGKAKKVLIIDLDARQGNGNAAIFAGDNSVFTYSMHQQYGYPQKRATGSMDIELHHGIEDEEYLEILKKTLPIAIKKFDPDFVFYIAGADIYAGDLLGDMSVSVNGIKERDKFVLTALSELKLPTVITFAGGYAKNINDTVDICLNTVKEAIEAFPLFNKFVHF